MAPDLKSAISGNFSSSLFKTVGSCLQQSPFGFSAGSRTSMHTVLIRLFTILKLPASVLTLPILPTTHLQSMHTTSLQILLDSLSNHIPKTLVLPPIGSSCWKQPMVCNCSAFVSHVHHQRICLAYCMLYAGFLLGLPFNAVDRGELLPKNVSDFHHSTRHDQ
jgi:hypothetical protein